ncbi:MAG: PilZ domain-containing protein [Deltaproteobacteria bacterium]|nr:PilZ domain-containing protein [Deltaproteobacteria bacterium]
MPSHLELRSTVVVKLEDQRAFLRCFYHHGSLGGIFVPGRSNLEAGDAVRLEFVFGRENRTVRSRGVVRWKRRQGAHNLAAGLGIEFLASERRTRDLLLDLASGRDLEVVRPRARRLPVQLTVRYESHSVMLSDLTDDLSEGGVFILSDEPLPVGTKIVLKLKPPGQWFAVAVRAEVMWRQGTPRCGFGVKFLFDRQPRVQAKIEALVNRLRKRVETEIELRPERRES